MKTFIPCLCFILAAATAAALPTTTVFNVVNIPITLTEGGYDISFGVRWVADGEPHTSAAGRIELRNSAGTLVGRLIADHTQSGGSQVTADVGTVSGVQAWITTYAWDGKPGDGMLIGQWQIRGLPAGNYSLRLYEYLLDLRLIEPTAVWTDAYWIDGAPVTVTPPPTQYTIATSATAGGSVSPGGTYPAGSVVFVTAAPDGAHDFAGWSGHVTGPANPVSVMLDADKTVQANFSLKNFTVTTSASSGGTVTAGGIYPYGTSVTVTAVADAIHRFTGWTGDTNGSMPSVLLTLTRPLVVQAVFGPKATQVITFDQPTSQSVGGPALTLSASASSGLPVVYTIISGPAVLLGNELLPTGTGAVTVEANQSGNADFLPASPVTRTITPVTAAVVRYQRTGRTWLQSGSSPTGTSFVLEQP